MLLSSSWVTFKVLDRKKEKCNVKSYHISGKYIDVSNETDDKTNSISFSLLVCLLLRHMHYVLRTHVNLILFSFNSASVNIVEVVQLNRKFVSCVHMLHY